MTLLDYYKMKLGIESMPEFLKEYLSMPSITRLKDITYLCGMDYASKYVYDFKEPISRYDHSLTVALMTWNLTHDIKTTIAALYHDAATPCFSHVIDYMNRDYLAQESTEKPLEDMLKKDSILSNKLKDDNIDIEDIINFKKYSIVDLERPKLCADRLDGIILTGISWTKQVDECMINKFIDGISLYMNEDDEYEIGFNNEDAAIEALIINNSIDLLCHTRSDNYMMELLANIVNLAIKREYISYEQLYSSKEIDLLNILNNTNDIDINNMLNSFYNMKKRDIPLDFNMPKIKMRTLNPIVCGKRMG